MQEFLVGLHSLTRWIVLLAMTAALVRGLLLWLRGGVWTGLDRGLTLAAVVTTTFQALLGILIWIVERRWEGDAFLGFIHPLVMLAALGIVHAGSARVRRADGAVAKGRTLAVSLFLALFLITAAIPSYSWSRAWVS